MTPERLKYFRVLANNRYLYSREWILELVNELEQLHLENERLKRTVKALQVAAISKAIEDSLEGE